MEDSFCEHKEKVDGYCKKCKIYLCNECQMSLHFEHIQEIQGLDSIFTKASQEYTQMISTLDKQLISSRPKVHPGVVDDAVAEVSDKIRAGYSEVLDTISSLKNQHMGIIQESPFVHRLFREKEELEGEEMKKVESFDQKLGETMKNLLRAITSENFEDAIPLLAGRFREELIKEAGTLDPYYEQQGKFLKHLETLKSVKPAMEYDKDVVEDVIQIRGVHDQEIVKLLVHSPRSNAVFVHVPSTRSVYKREMAEVQLLSKSAQTFIQGAGLVITGGRTIGGTCSNSVYVYQLGSEIVSCKNPMKVRRAAHAATSWRNNEVFVAGGYNEADGLLGSAESYDVNADLWKSLPSMEQKRKNLGLCMMGERYLYAIGGVVEGGGHETNEIEALDITKPGQWERKEIKGMPMMQKVGLAEIDENVMLIFGGKAEGKKRDQSYLVDFVDGILKEGEKLGEPESFGNRSDWRKYAGHIYAVSGSRVATTHIYQIKTGKWIYMKKEQYLLKYGWN